MKVFATSDPHYPYCKNKMHEVTGAVERYKPDVMIIAGDISCICEKSYREYLSFFDRFSCTKLAVAGNHDLWTENGSSLARYANLGRTLREHGFHYLDDSPVIVDNVGFVGNVGWYDYSFRLRNPSFDNPIVVGRNIKTLKEFVDDDYAIKKFRYLFEGMLYQTGWNDGNYIKWDYSDKEFLKLCLQKLENDLRKIHGKAEKIVAVSHHAPFENMLVRKENDLGWSIANAYMGSKKIGSLLLSYSKVKVLITGHTHISGKFKNGNIDCYNVSANYGNINYAVIQV